MGGGGKKYVCEQIEATSRTVKNTKAGNGGPEARGAGFHKAGGPGVSEEVMARHVSFRWPSACQGDLSKTISLVPLHTLLPPSGRGVGGGCPALSLRAKSRPRGVRPR